jgi:hypothetical protein
MQDQPKPNPEMPETVVVTGFHMLHQIRKHVDNEAICKIDLAMFPLPTELAHPLLERLQQATQEFLKEKGITARDPVPVDPEALEEMREAVEATRGPLDEAVDEVLANEQHHNGTGTVH